MRSSILIIIALFLLSFQIKKIPIILSEYAHVVIIPTGIKEKDKQIVYSQTDGYFVIKLFDVKGKMYLKKFRQDSTLMEEGRYVNSLALLRQYSTMTSMNTGKSVIKIREYYEPLRDGKWYFYDSTGIKKDSALYKRGILIK